MITIEMPHYFLITLLVMAYISMFFVILNTTLTIISFFCKERRAYLHKKYLKLREKEGRN